MESQNPNIFTKMQKIARATESTVVIGCYSYRDDWFASSTGVSAEIQGSTPEDAVDSLFDIVVQRFQGDAADSAVRVEKSKARLSELFDA